jgi:hypothetical protein
VVLVFRFSDQDFIFICTQLFELVILSLFSFKAHTYIVLEPLHGSELLDRIRKKVGSRRVRQVELRGNSSQPSTLCTRVGLCTKISSLTYVKYHHRHRHHHP